ncbi:MAG: sigma 54-interacting transcriptional regulator [Desulfobulbaceae bacterium]|nr:sigma 54-interacting transcriptional regulator [Desulfobulbaceae bacterium]
MEPQKQQILSKRIGDYLLEDNICDTGAIEKALEQQVALKNKGIFKPLGLIMIQDVGLAIKDLDRVLVRMHVDVLSSTSLFQNIPQESLERTVSLAEQRVLPENVVIFNRGDQDDTFFVVISGKVQAYVASEDGTENVLAILQAGEGFGEMALLTGEPRSTSVKTLEPTSLLVLSKNYFEQICALCPELSMSLVKMMANRVRKGYQDLVSASENEKAYQQFVSQYDELSLPDLIGQTRTINKLREKIIEASRGDLPVIVTGEVGTEKLVVAGAVHKASQRASEPFLTLNAEEASLDGYGTASFDSSDQFHLEIAQSSILFGHEKGAFSFAESRRLGLFHIGRSGTVVIENVDKLTPGVQQQLAEFIKTGTFQPVGSNKSIPSAARIMAASSVDLNALVEGDRFDRQLYEAFQTHAMTVPPIRKRKGDLRLLVDFLIIMECFKGQDRKLIKGISSEAYQRIMEYDWPGNMDELEVVIRRAINLTGSEYLMPEDIFVGMAPPEGKYTFNLLKLEQVRDFFTSRFYPVGVQVMTGAFFSIIFLLAFLGSQSPDSNVTLLLVWALWWPMLAISWFFGARIWCSICPMGAVNDLLNRICSLKKKVPKFIRNNSMYLSAAGLALIIYVEASSGMIYSPMATGFLLVAILSCAMLSGFIYERRVWCRYLCPLGRLAATFSGCSVIEWRSNSSICNSTCTTNACYKGNGEVPGCPVYQGPFSLHSNQDCILCGNCVKICENASPAFNIRIPGHELWAALKPEEITSIFVPVILGTQIFRGLEHTALAHSLESVMHSAWAAFALLLLMATVFSFIFVRGAGLVTFGPLKDNTIIKGDLFINGLIPLAFGFEVGYQFKPLFERLGHFMPIFGRQFGYDLSFLDFAAENGAAKPWQVFFVLLGMVVSMVFLKILIKNHQKLEEDILRPRPMRYVPVFFLAGVFIWMFVTA